MTEDFRKKLWNIAGGIPFDSEYFLRILPESKLKKSDLFASDFGTYYLELGSGWGEVAIELAQTHPEIGYVLMEKKADRIRKTIKAASRLKLTNVKILSVNFNWFLEDIFADGSFEEILLNFPDPWPKKRHHKHRTLSPRFLDSIHRLLVPGGRFRFATDYGPYARKGIGYFRRDPRFRSVGAEYSLFRKDFPVSYFEKTKREEGSRIYYLDRERI
ncbi:tRNA (guanosine(46)-N7)-methyltransferase TrmB [Leptospira fluminis]|uniref:tRNA (guanine-N(7)-)-methyltransferase n=1 Tax=Leptospira fluminis TaxID=2484979 RepID=A0A4R9GSB5_9LEPT|nr:tRNA (guanosine(46)-N7)-methyltransferase TrmB [Leptospira fluminis]TGK21078.1 tRNA (guanosine(46)-N7)-methyltransferase TrmB [Leptospira fluminis]